MNNITHTAEINEKVVSEEEIKQFIMEKFRNVKKTKNIKNLIQFQATNKYMIMAHNQEELKILGRIVASHKKISLKEIFREYEIHLKIALETMPTIKTHANVIMHIYGYFSKNLNEQERINFIDILQRFRKEEKTIGETLNEISNIIFQLNNIYLASQTYFLLYSNSQFNWFFELFDNLENHAGEI